VFVFCWILLGLLLLAGGVAWWGEVPTYVSGSGMLLPPPAGSTTVMCLIFLPATHPLQLRTGLPIQVRLGTTGTLGSAHIETVEPGIISPSEARQRYALGGNADQIITQPSITLLARVGPPFSAPLYAGSIVSAQVQTGSQRVLSLLPGLTSLIGGS
jgi:hypothetical protein